MYNKHFAAGLLLSFLLTLSLTACHRTDNQTVDTIDVDTALQDPDDGFDRPAYSGFDSLTVGQYHQLVLDAIVRGDKTLFADLVCYPLGRTYPLRDIEGPEQMIAYFDTLFPTEFRQQLSSLDSNSWECVGWRGWMILDGEIWDSDPRLVVNYMSPLEERYLDYLYKKDMATVHPSLRGNWQIYDCYRLDDSVYSFARLDASTLDKDFETEGGRFRIALFAKGSKPSDKPSVVLEGTQHLEGTLLVEYYDFHSKALDIVVTVFSPEDGKSYVSISPSNGDSRSVEAHCHYHP